MNKKNKIITFATTEENSAKIKERAQEKSWTISQVCHNIIQDYLSEQQYNPAEQEADAAK